MKNNYENLSVVAIIIAIVAIVGSGIALFAVTKIQAPARQDQTIITKDETLGWVTYVSALYGYKIKYPNDYSIFQEADDKKEKFISADLNSKKIFITDRPRMFFSSEPIYLSVEVLDSYVDNFEEWIIDKKMIVPENSYRVKQQGSISFAGEQAYQIQAESGLDSPGNIILVNHDSKTYYIRYGSEDNLQKISSTFEFTK